MRLLKLDHLLVLSTFAALWISGSGDVMALGVNWGLQASHLLPPSIVVQMLRDNGFTKVKLFDSNSSILNALADTNIEVMVGLPNDLLLAMTDQIQADAWVRDNVVRYTFPNGANIKYVAVGNEPFLRSYNGTYNDAVYSALVNIQKALDAEGLGDRIKATVPMNADIIEGGIVPSDSVFRPDIVQVITRIVTWLSQRGAPFTINFYPFISLYDDEHFPVDYAFFDGAHSPLIDGPYVYQNVFDASYDSLLVALAAISPPFANVKIIVGEIGWPTDGDVNANVYYAKKFNQGFLNHVARNIGTPRLPNSAIQFYLFSLMDEDMKSIGPGNFERHWGIFRYDGRAKYNLSLTASGTEDLVEASGVKYMARQWCIYNQNNGDSSSLTASMMYACENSDCTALGYGSSCNHYLDAAGNASYAFNNYFQRQNQGLGTCSFNGLGRVVTMDPSIRSCEFMIQIASPSYSSACSDWSNTWTCGSILCATVMLLSHLLMMRQM